MNPEIMREMGFEDLVKEAKRGNCPLCGKPIKISGFRDELSLREYTISGLCQKCQDRIFVEHGKT